MEAWIVVMHEQMADPFAIGRSFVLAAFPAGTPGSMWDKAAQAMALALAKNLVLPGWDAHVSRGRL